jgi:bifunctional DNA-binding transcriptional regulator/antitoxin component of YhaV-PrlF toxin-antitoxin module
MAARTRKQSSGFGEGKSRYAGPRSGGAGAKPARRRLPGPEALPDGTVRYALLLGPKGRVLFPADLRKALGLDEGDVITAWLRDGELRMHSHRHGLRKIQEEARAMPSSAVSASEELIAERRAESAKDAEEALRWLHPRRKRRR